MSHSTLTLAVCLVVSLMQVTAAAAQTAACAVTFGDSRSEFLSTLEKREYVIVMRHADRQKGDALTLIGERQTEKIKRAFVTLEIPTGQIIAAEADRVCDTANRAFGFDRELCDNIFAIELKERILGGNTESGAVVNPVPGGTIIVTHSGQIETLFELEGFGESLACGEAAIIERNLQDRTISCSYRVLPNEWLKETEEKSYESTHSKCPKDALEVRDAANQSN